MDQIKPEEKVCYNCKHFAWSVGIGQGLRCMNKKSKTKAIPNRRFVCDLFKQNKKLKA